jgi:hypothetical protein
MSGPSSPDFERSPATGRLAFRYFVENTGFSGANSDYIGIDRAVYNGPCGSPTPDRHSDSDCYSNTDSDSYGYSNTDGNGNCAPQLLQP